MYKIIDNNIFLKKRFGVKFDFNSFFGKEIFCYYLNVNEL